MLEHVHLGQRIPKEHYRLLISEYREELYHLQRGTLVGQVPVIVLFEGWDASGKGDAIHSLTGHLDPRTVRVFPILAPRTFEARRPWLWRFWRRIPARGRWVVFSGSWYRIVLGDRVRKVVRTGVWRRAYRDILDFERMLADDGYVIVKFFLHVSRREQKKRFKKLSKDPAHAYRVTTDDWDQLSKYEEYLEATEEMLQETDSEWGPWTVIDATDRRHCRLQVYQTLIARIEDQMVRRGIAVPDGSQEAGSRIRGLRESWSAGSSESSESSEEADIGSDGELDQPEVADPAPQVEGRVLDEEPVPVTSEAPETKEKDVVAQSEPAANPEDHKA